MSTRGVHSSDAESPQHEHHQANENEDKAFLLELLHCSRPGFASFPTAPPRFVATLASCRTQCDSPAGTAQQVSSGNGPSFLPPNLAEPCVFDTIGATTSFSPAKIDKRAQLPSSSTIIPRAHATTLSSKLSGLATSSRKKVSAFPSNFSFTTSPSPSMAQRHLRHLHLPHLPHLPHIHPESDALVVPSAKGLLGPTLLSRLARGHEPRQNTPLC